MSTAGSTAAPTAAPAEEAGPSRFAPQAWIRPRFALLLVAAVVGYAAMLLVSPAARHGVAAPLGLALGQGACGLALLWRVRGTASAMRRVWLLCGWSGLTSSGIFAVWTYYEVRAGGLPPMLTLADAFFIASVLLSLAAALSWPGVRGRRGGRERYVADGAVVAASLLLLSWSMVIAPGLSTLQGDVSWQVLVPLLYPFLDVLAVAAAFYAVGAAPRRTARGALLLLAGVLTIAVGDAVFAVLLTTGDWHTSPVVMVLWLAAFALMVAARFSCDHTTAGTAVHEREEGPARAWVVAPLVPVFASLVVAEVMPRNAGTIALVVGLLLLVLVRYAWLSLADRVVVQWLQRDARAEDAFIRVALQQLTTPVLACDAGGHVRYFNDAFAAGNPQIQVGEHIDVGSRSDRIFQIDGVTPVDQAELPLVKALRGQPVVDEPLQVRTDDGLRTYKTSARPILGAAGEILGAVLVKHDVTAEQKANAELVRRACTDELTGLGNRAQITAELQKIAGSGAELALILIDIDNFKTINDSLGHEAGDRLLVEVASRISSQVRFADVTARLGGDEFVVFVRTTEPREARLVAQRILIALAAPVDVAGTPVAITASIGIAMSAAAEGVTSLLAAADLAMYEAKLRGKAGMAMFEGHMHEDVQRRLSLENDLRSAVRERTLTLAYQPIVDLRTGALAGVEALARWHHPLRGHVSPADFIPVAEQTGMIHALGEWVLREAAAQLRAWQLQTGHPALVLSVNVSSRQLEGPRLLAVVDDLLAHGLDPAYLLLEITETAIGRNDDAAAATLQALRARGLRLALDDFGTGYSSLSRLRAAPVSRVKIDRSFVDEIDGPDPDAPIIDATLAMSKRLDLAVTAEGIETPEQLEYLVRNGRDQAQGFLLARPVDAAVISTMLGGDLPWSHLLPSTGAESADTRWQAGRRAG